MNCPRTVVQVDVDAVAAVEESATSDGVESVQVEFIGRPLEAAIRLLSDDTVIEDLLDKINEATGTDWKLAAPVWIDPGRMRMMIGRHQGYFKVLAMCRYLAFILEQQGCSGTLTAHRFPNPYLGFARPGPPAGFSVVAALSTRIETLRPARSSAVDQRFLAAAIVLGIDHLRAIGGPIRVSCGLTEVDITEPGNLQDRMQNIVTRNETAAIFSTTDGSYTHALVVTGYDHVIYSTFAARLPSNVGAWGAQGAAELLTLSSNFADYGFALPAQVTYYNAGYLTSRVWPGAPRTHVQGVTQPPESRRSIIDAYPIQYLGPHFDLTGLRGNTALKITECHSGGHLVAYADAPIFFDESDPSGSSSRVVLRQALLPITSHPSQRAERM